MDFAGRGRRRVRHDKTENGERHQISSPIGGEGMVYITCIVGAVNAQGPPVPIPNTEVKLCSAENT